MIFFLAVHIMALLVWCASLLFLLTLTGAGCPSVLKQTDNVLTPHRHDSVARALFTLVSTPAALLAIVSGTTVFLLTGTVNVWLVIKLTVVMLLVIGHTLGGALILRAESGHKVRPWSQLLIVCVALLMVTIVLLVLAKPESGDLVRSLPW
ncbi:MAG: CopD family protein [Pseudohongiella sp.]|uniref:CopD family protein n=1 Tax=Pseudohongiella sp. TaxID=1979412 RepID=UPI0034A061F4